MVFDMSTWNEKWKLVVKLDMLDFKEILMTEILCSIYMYLVCYKLSSLLAYLAFHVIVWTAITVLCTRAGADAGLGAP